VRVAKTRRRPHDPRPRATPRRAAHAVPDPTNSFSYSRLKWLYICNFFGYLNIVFEKHISALQQLLLICKIDTKAIFANL
jgi:hypothetical protein